MRMLRFASSALLLLAMGGCPAPVSPEQSGGGIQDLEQAPWSISGAHTLRWTTSPDGEEAILLISTASQSCDALTGVVDSYGFEELIGEGSGLLYYLWREGGGGWEGIYLGGYSYDYSAPRETERAMSVIAFHDSVLYFLGGEYGGGASWLKIDSVGSSVSGSFYTEFWVGEFSATNCGSWSVEPSDDTG